MVTDSSVCTTRRSYTSSNIPNFSVKWSTFIIIASHRSTPSFSRFIIASMMKRVSADSLMMGAVVHQSSLAEDHRI
jgi:hypothetical protein